MTYRIVETDNFGGDYPDERFIGEAFDTRAEAMIEADRRNAGNEYSPRYYKVVDSTYELVGGFEP